MCAWRDGYRSKRPSSARARVRATEEGRISSGGIWGELEGRSGSRMWHRDGPARSVRLGVVSRARGENSRSVVCADVEAEGMQGKRRARYGPLLDSRCQAVAVRQAGLCTSMAKSRELRNTGVPLLRGFPCPVISPRSPISLSYDVLIR